MNSWSFNSRASCFLSMSIAKFFGFELKDIYKEVKTFDSQTSKVTMKNGEEYEVVLKKIDK